MQNLAEIAKALVAPGKGILAADESSGTIKRRFDKVGIEDTIENHRSYRQLLFTTPGIEQYISGIILFEETIMQSVDDGKPFPRFLEGRGIIPGIKVDKGKEELASSPKEYITKGLEGLADRVEEYRQLGAKFTKWRNVYVVDVAGKLPSEAAIEENAKIIAEYAKIVQDAGLVPIVEPEVLMDGSHGLDDHEMATVRVQKKVFQSLSEQNVNFSAMLLKPNWVHPGLSSRSEPEGSEVAEATIRVLKEAVPTEVPGIVFLSGGDSPEDSTKHLKAINEIGNSPEGGVAWELSFSFGRALQADALKMWAGKEENVKMAQEVFLKRAKAVSEARQR